MAVSPERRRELLAAVGLAEPEAPKPVEVAPVDVTPTPQPRRVPNSVTVVLREEREARTTPSGIREEFAYKPTPWKRGAYSGSAMTPAEEIEQRWMWEKWNQSVTDRRRNLELDPCRLGLYGPIDD